VLTNLKYGDQIYLQKSSNVSTGVVYTITGNVSDNGTYCILQVRYLRNLGNFLTNNDECFFNCSIVGKDGINGINGVNGSLLLSSVLSEGNQGSTSRGIPCSKADIYHNSLGLIATEQLIPISSGPTVVFSGFEVGSIYRYTVHLSLQIALTTSNRVVRVGQRYTTGIPTNSDILQHSYVSTYFLQKSALFKDVCWSADLSGSFVCTTTDDKIFFTAESDIQTVGIGGYTGSPLTIIINRIASSTSGYLVEPLFVAEPYYYPLIPEGYVTPL
jgi:hypothetical protein